MNVLIPYSWLQDFLKTKVAPKEVAEKISLCGPSVERINKVGDDSIFDIEITTNRPDSLSILGIAREAAAILPQFGVKAEFIDKLKDIEAISCQTNESLPLDVKIQKEELCPRFTAILLDNVHIKSSPEIIKDRLEKVGTRSLNNIIDITNYLMFEIGQPMHAFDYDKIKNHTLFLRESQTGEKVITLDDTERKLPEGAVVMEDGEGRLIDLCGIMGGKNSEIDENTKRVLLFVQTYDPSRIRKTTQSLAFRTEAAARFEKGIDPEGVIPSLWYAVKLMQETSGARIASDLIDIYPHPQKPKTVKVSSEQLDRLLGIHVEIKTATDILTRLGFECQNDEKNITATIPSFRYDDINIPQDLVEEVARILGYHNLPSVLPGGEPPKNSSDPKFFWQERVKNALKYWGYTEIYSYSLVNGNLLEKCNLKKSEALRLKNPLNSDLEYLRTSLLPGILEIIAQNQANFEKQDLFELSKTYLPQEKDLPNESTKLMITKLGGNFQQIKGLVESLLADLGIKNIKFNKTTNDTFKNNSVAEVKSENTTLGYLGKIDKSILDRFLITNKVAVADLDFDTISSLATPTHKYTPLPKYPPTIEDLAIIVESGIAINDLVSAIFAGGGDYVRDVQPFDIFESEKLGIDKKSVAVRIYYQASDHTLISREVEKIRTQIIKNLKEKFSARIRQK